MLHHMTFHEIFRLKAKGPILVNDKFYSVLVYWYNRKGYEIGGQKVKRRHAFVIDEPKEILGLSQHLPQSLYKRITICIVPKDFPAFNPANYNSECPCYVLFLSIPRVKHSPFILKIQRIRNISERYVYIHLALLLNALSAETIALQYEAIPMC